MPIVERASPSSSLVPARRGPSTYADDAAVHAALALGSAGQVTDRESIQEMRFNRRVNGRTASMQREGVRGIGDISMATMRPRDPFFYWRENNLPYDIYKEDNLKTIRAMCRLLYLTHPVIASAIDIYSKYPLTGMEFQCKDPKLTEFYTELFFNQLDYEEFLVDVLREYWTVGEACALGSFNDMLGVWEDDELLNPDEVKVIRSPFMREPRFEINLPPVIRDILQEREPLWEYTRLMQSYPDLIKYLNPENKIPVSAVLLKQISFKADTFHSRGIPILMRAFRAIIQEEMLNSAQDAIASRLYTPLILARLGASATELGTQQPWIPDDQALMDFEASMDAALAADFRMITHNFAIDISTVFGRETMPNFDADFERLTERQLQVFGLSKTMLSGAGAGETYAADALNRDLISQLLTTCQRRVKKLYQERALVVAEAQGHFDYEKRGGKAYPIMEEVLTIDEETGEQRIVEQPKLLIPDLNIRTMNMNDENQLRSFMTTLRGSGVPISMKTLLVNVPVDFDDEIEKTREEQILLAVEAQETRKATFEALRNKGLPIPEDLLKDFLPHVQVPEGGQGALGAADVQILPQLGVGMPADAEALVPPPPDAREDVSKEQVQEEEQSPPNPGDPQGDNVVRLPRSRVVARPPESDEQRANMPKPAAWIKPDERGSLERGPRHVGMRRYANLRADVPIDEQDGEAWLMVVQ